MADAPSACRLRFSGCVSNPFSITTILMCDGFAFDGCIDIFGVWVDIN